MKADVLIQTPRALDIIRESRAANLTTAQTAYALSTAVGEAGEDLKPRIENLYYTTAARVLAVWPSTVKTEARARQLLKNPQKLGAFVYDGKNGNRSGTLDGWTYRGRGLVQLTGLENYRKAGALVGYDLVKDPDLALDPVISVRILVRGMKAGLFTGHTLAQHLNSEKADFYNARRIVNGTFEADKYAARAILIESALLDAEAKKAAGAPKPAVEAPKPQAAPLATPKPTPAPEAKPSAPAAQGLVAALIAGLASLFKGKK